MAIVRTTSKEPGTTGTAPPAVTAKPAVGKAPRPLARSMPNRAMSPAKPGDAGQFFTDIRTELTRVKWPTREEAWSGTIVTIAMLIFFALFIFGLDYVAEQLLKNFFFAS